MIAGTFLNRKIRVTLGIVIFILGFDLSAGISAPEVDEDFEINENIEITVLPSYNDPVFSLVFSPDGRFIAAGSWGYSAVKLWDIERQECVCQFNQEVRCSSIAFSQDGKTIIARWSEGEVYLLDVDSQKCVRVSESGVKKAFNTTRSPSVMLRVPNLERKVLKLFDVGARECIHKFGHKSDVFSFALSPDQTQVAAGLFNGKIIIYTDLLARRAMKVIKDEMFALSQSTQLRLGADSSAQFLSTDVLEIIYSNLKVMPWTTVFQKNIKV